VDQSQTRVACENGSHNASLLLKIRNEQEHWWRARGIPENEPVHHSENTTEVIVYEWERIVHQIQEGGLDQESMQFIQQLRAWEIDDIEEQALRLTLWSLRPGNAHACTFQSRYCPGILYVSSHNKPIAIIIRTTNNDDKGYEHQEIMVASDLNAGLMLWPGDQVDAAVDRIDAIQWEIQENMVDKEVAKREIHSILDAFSVDVLFLDQELYSGQELFARIENQVEDGNILPKIKVTRYDGTPIACVPQRIKINPSMVGKRGYPSYTELHIAEIPDVLDRIVSEYYHNGEIRIESSWLDNNIFSPGLNLDKLTERFGARLERLKRLMLIGEGSSWRDAQAAAPLFRALLPDVLTVVYRPVEVLNLGKAIDAYTDLVVEISWSGTTDSLLKMDSWLTQGNVLRLGVTGRPQSDLGRRTAPSGGTLDVQSGVEVSVATVKGFEAILMTLYLTALKLAELHYQTPPRGELSRLKDVLTLAFPKHVRDVIQDVDRRERIRRVARRCQLYNKVAVVGNSPIEIEAELKIEELAQIVACPFDFHAPSLRSLIERSAIVTEDRQRTLFVINATSDEAQNDARTVINYLNSLGVFCIVHTTPSEQSESWQSLPHVEVFYSPQVSDKLQPLIDAPFFFELAVALAYARGLSSEEIDRPRNLAKSVTTTSAEKRSEIEFRRDFFNITLEEFSQGESSQPAWDVEGRKPTREALQASTSLRTALAVLTEALPERLGLESNKNLILVTDTEATENAGKMARGAWAELLGLDITVFRRFLDEVPKARESTKLIHLLRAGAILTVKDSETITLPADFSPLQLELLGTVYLIGLAVRLARRRGMNTDTWEAGMARLPFIVATLLGNQEYAQKVRAILEPFVETGYDKAQIIGGGQDYTAGESIARSLRSRGFMAEALYTDSAWHGPLAAVGGPDADHDTLTVILATDRLFQSAAMVDTQVYRTRRAPVILVVPEGNQDLLAVRGVDASAILTVPALPRPFVPVANAALGAVLAREMNHLWSKRFD
jgi:glucosamine 6-phosphate synthetase-like amidotransferase/phosphosugar isomerase protein